MSAERAEGLIGAREMERPSYTSGFPKSVSPEAPINARGDIWNLKATAVVTGARMQRSMQETHGCWADSAMRDRLLGQIAADQAAGTSRNRDRRNRPRLHSALVTSVECDSQAVRKVGSADSRDDIPMPKLEAPGFARRDHHCTRGLRQFVQVNVNADGSVGP